MSEITHDNILRQIDLTEIRRHGSDYPDLTYEDGVRNALLWIFYDGRDQDPPMPEEEKP